MTRFHASAPPGQWLNDPNALFFDGNDYRLFAQHAEDAPEFAQIGWGGFASSDLLDWRWTGVAVPPSADGAAYSGSIVAGDGGHELFFTRHGHGEPRETQRRAVGPDWREQPGVVGPAGRNCRDPFVFACPAIGDWRMIVAEPCDWHDWQKEAPSRLKLWRSPDRVDWVAAGTIGPWHPPGVMWEVPVLVDFGALQTLIVSLVDRRDGATKCSVIYWLGRFDAEGFERHPRFPPEGRLLDQGPDFYAAIANLEAGWPGDVRVVIGWASNWEQARGRRWGGDWGKGGAISLPRVLSLDATTLRLRQVPCAASSSRAIDLGMTRPGQCLRLCNGGDAFEVLHTRETLCWTSKAGTRSTPGAEAVQWTAFWDAPLLELFADTGDVGTVVLPGASDLQATIDCG